MQIGKDTAARLRPHHPATLVLAGAMLASATLLIAVGSRLSFLLDDWVFILYRRGFDLDAFVRPDNEHFVAGPVAIWKLLLATFGIGSTVPFRVVSTALFLVGVGLMFVWVRRRVGEWASLLAAILVLFLGAAFDDVLWFSSITFLGSMACGLAMLVALDRRDRVGDGRACIWLVGSLLFSSLWLAFAAGAALDIVLRRGERSWRGRAYVVVVPALLFAAWWLGWGHTAESALSFHNLATTPLFVLDSIAAAIAALLGLAIPVASATAPNGLDWGRPLAILLIGLAAWRMSRLERIPRSLWVVLAVGLAFWVLGGLDVKPGRAASDSRYQYPSAVFVLLFAAELLRGVRLGPRIIAPALAVTGAAVLANVTFLHEAYESYLRTSQIERADLAAIEIARDEVDPGLILSEDIADTGYVSVDAGSYLSARDVYGSPAYDLEELAGAPEAAHTAADKVLAAALRIQLFQAGGRPGSATPAPRLVSAGEARPVGGGACVAVVSSAASPAVLELPSGGASLRSSGEVELRLRRYAPSYPVRAGTLAPGRWSSLAIPTDRSDRHWQLKLLGSAELTACGLAR